MCLDRICCVSAIIWTTSLQLVLGYHNTPSRARHVPDRSGTLLDLGCGHVLISRGFASSFERIFAVDPSSGISGLARAGMRRETGRDVGILGLQGPTHHWPPIDPGLCDKFNYHGAEPAPGMNGLARFWERPARNILRDSYTAIVLPEAEWEDVRTIAWDPNNKTGGLENAPGEALWLRKTLKLCELEAFFQAHSSYSAWKDAHPARKCRAEGGEDDIIDRMWDEILKLVPAWKAVGDRWRDVEIEAGWGTAVLLARKR
ncbi:hypothetical protein GQ53DRAFT_790388 [Thozetella sp. PMI_491]|nr:hypothetical protein GQ53DRAFT_790388 [Thozetella sp. PMI_491]